MVSKAKSVDVALALRQGSFVRNIISLAFLITLVAGCGGGSASSTSQPTNPTQPTHTAPVTPAGWVTVDRQDYSFAYPEGWKLKDGTQDARVVTYAIDAKELHFVMTSFDPGFVNKTDAESQCTGVDNYLQQYYEAYWERLATPEGKYPYTTVTNDGIQPAPVIGGEEMTVSIVTQSAAGDFGTRTEVWLDAVPRKGGLYLLAYLYPDSEPQDPFRREFIGSIDFKSGTVDPYCNYLGTD